MTIRHLKIYIAVCETGTLTAAGKKLYIAQPAISLAISELETHYGVRFFDRISNRLHITDSGIQFLQYAQHIISLFDEMEYNTINSDTHGILRVGSSITIGNYFLSDFILEFKKLHPHISVNVAIQNSKDIESAVLDNQIDIGLIEGPIHSNYLTSNEFMKDSLQFICSPSHSFANQRNVPITKLNNQDFLLREKGSGGREVLDGLVDGYSLSINKTWESTSTQAIIRGVEHGFGIALLPYLLVEKSINCGTICPFAIENISLKRDFSIVYHKNKFLTKNMHDFIEICLGI